MTSSAESGAAPEGSATGYLFRRTSLYTAGLIVQYAVQVVCLPLLTRALPTRSFGEVVSALVVMQLLSMVLPLGLATGIGRVYFLDEGVKRSRELVILAIGGVLVLGLVADGSGGLWSPALLGIRYSTPERLAVLGAAGLSVMYACQGFLRAADRVVAFLSLTLVSTVIGQVVGIVLVTAFDLGSTAYVGSLAVSSLLAGAIGVVIVRPAVALPPAEVVRWGLRFSLPTVPQNLSLVVLSAGDRFVIAHVIGLAAVGRYQVAYAVGSLGIMLVAAVGVALPPLIHGQPVEHRWRVWAELGSVVVPVMGVISGGLAIGAPFALTVVAPPSYDRGALAVVAALVAASLVPLVLQSMWSIVLLDSGRTGALAVIAIAAAAGNLGLNLVLVPVVGLRGAGLATLLAYAGQAAALHRVASAWTTVALPRRSIVDSVIIGGVLIGSALLLPADGIAALSVRGVVGAAAAAWALFAIVRAARA